MRLLAGHLGRSSFTRSTRTRVGALALGLTAAFGCTAERRNRAASPEPVTVRSEQTNPADPAVESPGPTISARARRVCAQIEREQRATFERLREDEDFEGRVAPVARFGLGLDETWMPLDPVDVATLPPELARCVPANGGAWVFTMDLLAKHPCGSSECIAYEMDLHHIAENGSRAFAHPIELGKRVFERTSLSVSTMRINDWGKDGVAQLVLCLDWREPRRDQRILPDRYCDIFTVTDDRVESYVSLDFLPWDNRLQDVDGDGELDIVFWAYDDDGTSCSLKGDCAVRAVELAAIWRRTQSKPFYAFDPGHSAAKEHAKKSCPVAPKRIATSSGDATADYRAFSQSFTCARLWGVSPELLKKELAQARATLCKSSNDCPEFDHFDRLVTADPVLRLP